MGDSTPKPLTARQREVVILVASGLTSKEIAHRLGITYRTAIVHRSGAMNRLKVNNASALTAVAIRMGLVQPK